ncbi:hypothetical protein ElyMa_007049300 [Elysia marginata]|uniref:Uncharacterized protein n=1 Tax=Elysia marginata TaxID=1093978 RepID=A0AAV4JVF8_9GAST|nr:hypothetical protein ElyMa_007049300 [Elysia marginata]
MAEWRPQRPASDPRTVNAIRVTAGVIPRAARGDRYVAHVPSGRYHQYAGKIHTLSNQVAPGGCQDTRKSKGDRSDINSKSGPKRRQQQEWTEVTSTARVDRSDVNSKSGLKRRQQKRWTEATSTAKQLKLIKVVVAAVVVVVIAAAAAAVVVEVVVEVVVVVVLVVVVVVVVVVAIVVTVVVVAIVVISNNGSSSKMIKRF